MPQWFPAIRAALARRGLHPPQPYPHTVRTLLGSALAALISGTIIGIFSLLYSLACFTVDLTLQATESLTKATTEMAASLSADAPIPDDAATTDLKAQATDSATNPQSAAPSEAPNRHLSSRKALLPDDAILQEARAPLLHRDLPYPEYRRLPLSEAVRQMDFALVQTVLRLNIERGRIVLLGSEYRKQNGESYLYQRMRIFLPPVAAEAAEGIFPAINRQAGADKSETKGDQPSLPQRIVVDVMADFVGTLEENLDAWAGRGILSEQPGKITLSVGSVATHEIWLEVTTDQFVPVPEEPLSPSPKLTIVMNGLGHDRKAADTLLGLPVPVTFAIAPDAPQARELAEKAWKAGHEILLHQPMQSSQWPYVKAGSDEITVDMSDDVMADILRSALENVPHASGLANHMGSRLSGDRAASARFVARTAAAGLYLLDTMTQADSRLYPEAVRQGLPAWKRDISLDDGHPSAHVVLASLKKAEQLAAKKGFAIVTGRPYPETLEALRLWSADRDRSVAVVPLRALPPEQDLTKSAYGQQPDA